MNSQARLLRAAFQYLREKAEENRPGREQKASMLLGNLLTLVLLRNRNRDLEDNFPWVLSEVGANDVKSHFVIEGEGVKYFWRDPVTTRIYLSWQGMELLTSENHTVSPENVTFLGHKGVAMEGLAIDDLTVLSDSDALLVAEQIRSYLQRFEIGPS